jgi:hypothetical protein
MLQSTMCLDLIRRNFSISSPADAAELQTPRHTADNLLQVNYSIFADALAVDYDL